MKKTAILYITLAGVLWGTSGIFVHYLSPYGFTSYQMTAVRAIVSFLCILVYALVKDRGLLRVRPLDLLLSLGIGTSLFFTASCYFVSMQMTSVSTAVVLMYTSPIYVTIFSVLFLKERLTAVKLVAVLGMLVGCALVSGIVGGFAFDTAGILIGLFSGVAYASYNVLTKISVERRVDPVSVTLYGFLFMSLISLCFLEPTKLCGAISVSPAVSIPLLLGLGICTFVVPYFLYTLAMKHLAAGTAASLAVIEPMAATVFSVVLFGERPDLFAIAGTLLILGAIFMIGKTEREM